jgi:allose kinase
MPVRNTFYSGDVLKDLERKIKSFCDGFSFAAVSIGFPATLNVERTRVIQAPNVPFMENLPVCEELSDAFKVPVFAERDVTFALCYDLEKFSISDTGIVCGIYFGTGIGNAIAIDGNPVAGAHGTAGELGHIPVAGCGIECGCGNKGCLEAVAGGKALSSLQCAAA